MIRRFAPLFGGMTLPALAALLVLMLSVWLYWPGHTGPDLLDDRTSVLVLNGLADNPEQAWDYIFGDRSGAFGRSVSMVTFVAEELYLGGGLSVRKKVNILLHAVNGLLVTWLLWCLFRYRQTPHYRFLAVVLGATWLLHPLFVSTVLYVVQRMAMLSTFFLLLTLLSYLYWRFALIEGRRAPLRLVLVLVFFALGMAAKENTVVALPIILLLEVMWLDCRGRDQRPVLWAQRGIYALIAVGVIGASLVLVLGYDQLAERFHRRPFTLDERLFTQARILWDYVAQLVMPATHRMGLYHDDWIVSQSLNQPALTLWAVVGWAAVAFVVLLFWLGKHARLVAFGISWFLVAHTVESTVLPLEMVFEHRNYAPAIGLVIALGGLFHWVATRWRPVAAPLLVWLVALPLWFALQTSPLVLVWSSRPLLTLHHLNGHPTSARANNDMAALMAGHGELDAALGYSLAAYNGSQNKAAANERYSDYLVRNLALSCAANQPPPPGTIEQVGARDVQRPLSSVPTLLTMVRLLQDNACPHIDRVVFADRMAQILLIDDRRRGAAALYSAMAILENALGRFDNALAYIEHVLRRSPNNRQALLMKLHFATALDRAAAVEEAVERLQSLQAQGKLTTAQRQTLALYVEK